MIIYKDGHLFKRAGWKSPEGYLKLTVNGKTEYAHRYIYKMHLGEIPEGMDVDHIDGDRANNLISNLRILPRSDNAFNRQGANANSKSGVRGVSWHKASQKYIVQIRGKHYGCFLSQKEAEQFAAQKFKELEL